VSKLPVRTGVLGKRCISLFPKDHYFQIPCVLGQNVSISMRGSTWLFAYSEASYQRQHILGSRFTCGTWVVNL